MNAVMKVIDMELAIERAGGSRSLARDLFAMLLKELPEHRNNIQQSLNANDLILLQAHVHKLNGSATYTGVPALKAVADGLESRMKRGEIEDLQEQVQKVFDEIERVLTSAEQPRR